MRTKIVVFLFFAISFATWGQASKKIVQGNNCYLEEIGKNVYAILHEDATDEWPHSNTGVIVGEKEVMVTDVCYSQII